MKLSTLQSTLPRQLGNPRAKLDTQSTILPGQSYSMGWPAASEEHICISGADGALELYGQCVYTPGCRRTGCFGSIPADDQCPTEVPNPSRGKYSRPPQKQALASTVIPGTCCSSGEVSTWNRKWTSCQRRRSSSSGQRKNVHWGPMPTLPGRCQKAAGREGLIMMNGAVPEAVGR
jgi:hypothetical protein